MSTPVTLLKGSLPADFCFTDAQQFYEAMIDATTAEIPGTGSGVIISEADPMSIDPGYASYLWVKVDGTGKLERIYTYSGEWVSPHSVPASGDERRIYVGANDATGLWLYDGGDGTDPAAATPTSGSFWMVDTAFDFKFPVGVGTNAVAYGGANTTINVGDTGGEEKHVLLEAELPAHSHNVILNKGSAGSSYGLEAGADTDGTKTTASEDTGSDTAHNTMPPYVGVYFIKRSARIFHTA